MTGVAAIVAILAFACAVRAAEPPSRGDPRPPYSGQPSPEDPVGWRGDGNGRFPAADPPLAWGRVAKSVRELRSQAREPKEGETGKPISDLAVPQRGPADVLSRVAARVDRVAEEVDAPLDCLAQPAGSRADAQADQDFFRAPSWDD